MRSIIFIAFCTVILPACENNDGANTRKDGFTPVLETKEDSLYHDVMEGHDIGMAKMGQLRGYRKQAQQVLDSLNELPTEKLDVLYQQAVMDVQEDLNYADYSMNTWMEEFKADSAGDNKEVRIQYLEAEKAKVTRVKEAILNSLQRADSLFKE